MKIIKKTGLLLLLGVPMLFAAACGSREVEETASRVIVLTITPPPSPTPVPENQAAVENASMTEDGVTMTNQYLLDEMDAS